MRLRLFLILLSSTSIANSESCFLSGSSADKTIYASNCTKKGKVVIMETCGGVLCQSSGDKVKFLLKNPCSSDTPSKPFATTDYKFKDTFLSSIRFKKEKSANQPSLIASYESPKLDISIEEYHPKEIEDDSHLPEIPQEKISSVKRFVEVEVKDGAVVGVFENYKGYRTKYFESIYEITFPDCE